MSTVTVTETVTLSKHMALTPAEKQKAYRERQKLRAAGSFVEPQKPKPFKFPNDQLKVFISADHDRWEALDYVRQEGCVGNELDFLLDATATKAKDAPHEVAQAESLVRGLILALEVLTGTLSEYRSAQVDQEIDQLKRTALNDPSKQDEALADIVRLTELRKQLDKKFRVELSEYRVPAE